MRAKNAKRHTTSRHNRASRRSGNLRRWPKVSTLALLGVLSVVASSHAGAAEASANDPRGDVRDNDGNTVVEARADLLSLRLSYGSDSVALVVQVATGVAFTDPLWTSGPDWAAIDFPIAGTDPSIACKAVIRRETGQAVGHTSCGSAPPWTCDGIVQSDPTAGTYSLSFPRSCLTAIPADVPLKASAGILLFRSAQSGAAQFVRDSIRSTSQTTSSTTTTSTTTTSGQSGPAADGAGTTGSGYWMAGADGAVFAFGDARWFGNSTASAGSTVDIARTPEGAGYLLVSDQGMVQSFGNAVSRGDATTALMPKEVVVSISVSRSGGGYWLFTDRGRVLEFGDARALGDLAQIRINAPVVDSIVTPSGNGYYLIAADGGVFTFGDASFHGSTGGLRLNQPVRSLVPDPDGSGYWLVATDGGVFSFDADFLGSMGGSRLNRPITGMVGWSHGYLMVAADGGVFAFGDARFAGSLGGNPPSAPIVSIASLA